MNEQSRREPRDEAGYAVRRRCREVEVQGAWYEEIDELRPPGEPAGKVQVRGRPGRSCLVLGNFADGPAPSRRGLGGRSRTRREYPSRRQGPRAVSPVPRGPAGPALHATDRRISIRPARGIQKIFEFVWRRIRRVSRIVACRSMTVARSGPGLARGGATAPGRAWNRATTGSSSSGKQGRAARGPRGSSGSRDRVSRSAPTNDPVPPRRATGAARPPCRGIAATGRPAAAAAKCPSLQRSDLYNDWSEDDGRTIFPGQLAGVPPFRRQHGPRGAESPIPRRHRSGGTLLVAGLQLHRSIGS